MKMLISNIELDSKSSRELIPLECLECKQIHYRPKNTILRILNGGLKGTGKGCFCSHKCKCKHRRNFKVYNCKQCGKEIERTPSSIRGGNIFCNSSCSAKFNNIHRESKSKKENNIKTKIVLQKIIKIKDCKFCKKQFEIKNRNSQIYCSSSCKSKEYQQQIYSDISNGIVTGHSNRTVKNYLIHKRGCRCEMCCISEWQGRPLTIILDHIDGNSDNWVLSNLRLICSNCDTLTPTYKKRNNGNGRYSRRERYKNNQSY